MVKHDDDDDDDVYAFIIDDFSCFLLIETCTLNLYKIIFIREKKLINICICIYLMSEFLLLLHLDVDNIYKL